MKVLEQKGEEIKEVMSPFRASRIWGFCAIWASRISISPSTARQAARFGINVADIQDAIQTAVGGNAVSQVLQGEAVYDLIVRYQEPYRDTKEAIQDIRLLSPSGERVSLAQLTKVEVKDGAYDIYREDNSRYVAIRFEVRDRDLGTTVAGSHDKINQKVQLPRGYHLEWAGEYESEKRAEARLLLIVPITILVIFIILYTMFRRPSGPCSFWPPWPWLRRRTAGSADYRYVLQRVLRRWLPGAVRRFGANRRHHARIHQPAARARLHRRRRRRRRRGPAASPHHDDHAGGDVRPLAGGFLACHRFRFAAALRHRHRRRPDRRPGHEHLHSADALRLVRARSATNCRNRRRPLKPNRNFADLENYSRVGTWPRSAAVVCSRFLLAPCGIQAQVRTGPVRITLDEAIQMAIQHNHNLLALNHDPAERGRRDHARPAPQPHALRRLGVFAARLAVPSKPDVYSGVSTPDYLKNNTEGDIGLSYLIERGGKRLDRLQAQKDITAQTRSLVADNERGLTFQVATLFFNAQLAESTLDLAEQDLKSFQRPWTSANINTRPAASARTTT